MFTGPVWDSYLKWTDMCNDGNWITNALLIDNWYGDVVKGTYCMPWGWYISASFQMYLGLAFLVCMFHSLGNKIGNFASIVWIVLGLLVSYLSAYNHGVLAYILQHLYPYGTANLDNLSDYLHYSYFYTYTRIACYYLGAMFGFQYFWHK